ncbi:hypothetical protein [Polaromonas sp. JS666]|uniref:hypothetical protein n=1 Tax=Polaromonas sp. (strain JS666 / ATCC BAA-500) TaxID=296591 RepID=UPI00005371B7|nr:hypothetical protein [Polaromonas sp. JS666]ABE46832.1 hypothetical protein Bpro_4959 [Polaromonas sp. JS666]
MSDASPAGVRVRVTLDSDTPELVTRLTGSKRQAREIVHLLRLGLQMEMMLNGKLPMVGIVSDGGASSLNRAPAPAAPVPAQVSATGTPADIPFGGDFAEMTGLDAGYFEGAPIAYSD